MLTVHSTEVMSPPPDCVITSYSFDSFRVQCERKKSTGSVNNGTNAHSGDTTKYSGGNKNVLRSQDRGRNNSRDVTISQATRVKSTSGSNRNSVKDHNIGVWHDDTSKTRYNNRTTNKNDILHDLEYKNKNNAQTPYVTLENKKQVKANRQSHETVDSDGGNYQEVSDSHPNRKSSEDGIKQQARTDYSGDNEDTNGFGPPYFILTVREQETRQLIRNETSEI